MTEQYDRELADSLNRQMTDNTPALPVTEAGRALLDDGHSILQHAYSPCSGDCWLGRGILAIEAEAAQARDGAWDALYQKAYLAAHYPHSGDASPEACSMMRCAGLRAARALIEKEGK